MNNLDFKETVTEEMHPEKEWFAEARQMTEEGFPNFFERIVHGYNHDYGTACHAVAACALAAASAACSHEGIGLTGFQAGFVMWDFIKNWTKISNICGLKLIDYDNMLYPQYEEKMDKTIHADNWKAIQEQARKYLNESSDDDIPWEAAPEVAKHWKSIVDGHVPFGYKVVDD